MPSVADTEKKLWELKISIAHDKTGKPQFTVYLFPS